MSKISAYGAYASPQANALLPVVDVNDHTMSGTGTTKNITLGALGLPVISVLNPAYGGGADPTGTNDSTAAIQAALNAVPSTGAVVVIPAGTYKTTSTLNIIKPLTFVQGAGQRISTIKYYGTGDCIYMHADNYTDFSNFLFEGGGIKGITVDGTNSTGVATGLNFGDWYTCEFDMHVLKFGSVGSYGVRFFNSMGFTEKTRGYFAIQQCDTNFTFDVSTTTSTANRSFGYTDLTIEMDGMTGNGIVVQNGAQVYHSRIAARANVSAGVGSSYACIVVKGKCAAGIQNPGSASQIVASRLDFQAEANSATNVQQTVQIDLGNNCRITNCTGIMDFNFNAQMALSNVSQTGAGSTYFQYSGVVSGDTNLNPGGAGSGLTTVGPRLYSKGRVDSNGTFYAALGDFFSLTLSANTTVSLTGFSPNVAGPQRKTILIQQAASGGPYTVTWPTTGSPTTSSPNVVWASGTAPVQTTVASGINIYNLITFDGATWYGQALTQDSPAGIVPAKVTAMRVGQALTTQYLTYPNGGTTGTSAGAWTLGTVYLSPIEVQTTQTFTGLSMNLNAQATGGTTPLVLMGLYPDNGLGIPTGSIITGSACQYNPVTQATGNVDINFSSPLTLSPGTYWAAWTITSGTALATQPTFVTLSVIGNTVLSTLGNSSQKGYQTTTSGSASSLPTGITVFPGSGSWPLIALKAQ